MAERDPFPAEFAALRAAVVVTPPGPGAAHRWVRRRRRSRAAGGLLALACVFGVAVAGLAGTGGAGTGAAGALVRRSGGTAGSLGPSPSRAGAPAPLPSSAACRSGVPVHLTSRSGSEVFVQVDGGYRLCPGQTVRVSWASYTVDQSGTQRLYRSGTGMLSTERDTIALTVQTPACGRYTLYVISGAGQPQPTIRPSTAPTRSAGGSGTQSGELVYAQDAVACPPTTPGVVRPAVPMR